MKDSILFILIGLIMFLMFLDIEFIQKENTNQHFNDECWRNGLRLEKIFPKNATALVNHRILASQLCGSNFNWHDSSKFAQWALPFFQNHIDIDYIVIPTKENSIDGCN